MKRWISTPKPLAGAPPASKPAQNLRSQPHGSRRALSLWCWPLMYALRKRSSTTYASRPYVSSCSSAVQMLTFTVAQIEVIERRAFCQLDKRNQHDRLLRVPYFLYRFIIESELHNCL